MHAVLHRSPALVSNVLLVAAILLVLWALVELLFPEMVKPRPDQLIAPFAP